MDDSNETRAGFFAGDYRTYTALQKTRWIDPGDWYHLATTEHDADGVLSTDSVLLSQAQTAWENLTRAQRYLLRMHHNGGLIWKHATLDIWVYFVAFIPIHRADELRAFLVPGEFEYLGNTFSDMRTKIVNRSSLAFFKQFFPNNRMDEVIFGYESSAQ